MLEFCEGAPSGMLLKTCMHIYAEAWGVGFIGGIGMGVIGLIGAMLIYKWWSDLF